MCVYIVIVDANHTTETEGTLDKEREKIHAVKEYGDHYKS